MCVAFKLSIIKMRRSLAGLAQLFECQTPQFTSLVGFHLIDGTTGLLRFRPGAGLAGLDSCSVNREAT